MNSRLSKLLETFKRFGIQKPIDLASANPGAAPDSFLSPWSTWILIGLVRHLKRQRMKKGVRSEWHLKHASSGASVSYVHLD